MKEITALWVGAGAGRRQVRILFSCAGRRIELITAFLQAGRDLGIKPVIHTADVDPVFAAACISDQAHQIPAARSSGYVPALLQLVKKHEIDLLIPLLDTELLKLSRARPSFDRLGCAVLVSSPRVIQICQDKLRMFEFLEKQGIDTPQTWPLEDVVARRKHRFPYFFKPRQGSASQSVSVVRNQSHLKLLASQFPDGIVQEYVPGTEHTLDVYTGFDGRPRCVVPRRRIEVRGGEVTKACTVKNTEIIETGVRVTQALAECVGLINIQLIVTPQGQIRVIEVNPRFGGGVPLAIRAGANFPKWLLAEWLGQHPRIRLDQFEEGLTMVRYHQSFFVNGAPPKSARKRS